MSEVSNLVSVPPSPTECANTSTHASDNNKHLATTFKCIKFQHKTASIRGRRTRSINIGTDLKVSYLPSPPCSIIAYKQSRSANFEDGSEKMTLPSSISSRSFRCRRGTASGLPFISVPTFSINFESPETSTIEISTWRSTTITITSTATVTKVTRSRADNGTHCTNH